MTMVGITKTAPLKGYNPPRAIMKYNANIRSPEIYIG